MVLHTAPPPAPFLQVFLSSEVSRAQSHLPTECMNYEVILECAGVGLPKCEVVEPNTILNITIVDLSLSTTYKV